MSNILLMMNYDINIFEAELNHARFPDYELLEKLKRVLKH